MPGNWTPHQHAAPFEDEDDDEYEDDIELRTVNCELRTLNVFRLDRAVDSD
jgi:hypothetical protein